MKNNNNLFYIVVSTEDDIHLVKGGIGTYIGLLVDAFAKYRPDIHIIWLTESPSDKFFVMRRDTCRTFYIPQPSLGYKISRLCKRICRLLTHNKSNKLFIESPDWEGLLADLYATIKDKNIVKITRLHSMLELTKQTHPIFSEEEKEQINQEHTQLLHTDIISAPTEYVYNFTQNLFHNQLDTIPYHSW